MGRKHFKKTEIKIAQERMQWLVNQWMMQRQLMKQNRSEAVYKQFGYQKNENGEFVFVEGQSARLWHEEYKTQIELLSKKVSGFYSVLNSLQSEKLKHIAELRYIDGYSWQAVADAIDETESAVYNYRSILANKFRDGGCKWAIDVDRFVD